MTIALLSKSCMFGGRNLGGKTRFVPASVLPFSGVSAVATIDSVHDAVVTFHAD